MSHELTESTPLRQRVRSSRWVPVLAGAVIAALGLTLGGLAVADAQSGSPDVKPPSTVAPRHGDDIPNVTIVESTIKNYYGAQVVPAPPALQQSLGITTMTIPSTTSNYAKEIASLERYIETTMYYGLSHHRPNKTPALVLDVDDTSLNTYNYEIYSQFAYNPTTNGAFVDAKAFPAVFGMPDVVKYATAHHYAVFFITGRPEAQRAATAGNLTDVGFDTPVDTDHLFLKNTASPPPYLPCGATCTTDQYKSYTRAYIETLGYDIIASVGDQYSDFSLGNRDYGIKLPNPMYYLP